MPKTTPRQDPGRPARPRDGCAGYLQPESAKKLRDSLARIQGHVGAIRDMVDDRRCADELLTQLAATRASLARVAGDILQSELRSCLGAWEKQDPAEAERRFDEAMRAVALMLKQS